MNEREPVLQEGAVPAPAVSGGEERMASRKLLPAFSTVLVVAVWAATSSLSSADGGDAAQSHDPARLKRQIESTERELATERDRGEALERRLQCTENQLGEYAACSRRFENSSEDYWRCVEKALAQFSPCSTE